MNRSFKIVKNAMGQFVVASEFARAKGKGKTILFSCLLALHADALSSIVSNQYDYRDYRNFAENKGKFTAGATNIPLVDKSGQSKGTLYAEGIPMPDFSAVKAGTRTGTLVSPQYTASVAHNPPNEINHYRFGYAPNGNLDKNGYVYFASNLNYAMDVKEFGRQYRYSLNGHDFATPRLTKLVTEVEPTTPISKDEIGTEIEKNTLLKSNGTFIASAHIGSGKQEIYGNATQVASYYKYPIGAKFVNEGELVNQSFADKSYLLSHYKKYLMRTMLRDNIRSDFSNGSLVNFPLKWDSGSPIFFYNKETKKWGLAGVIHASSPSIYYTRNIKAYYSLFDQDFLKNKQQEIANQSVVLQNEGNFTWENKTTHIGESELKNNQTNYTLKVANYSAVANHSDIEALENGRDLYVKSNTTITLTSDIDQGAGGIYIGNSDKPANVTIQANNNHSWVGSGIVVEKDSHLTWKVKQPDSTREPEKGEVRYSSENNEKYLRNPNSLRDRLSKLGKGTMRVTGNVSNPNADISVGEGTVILAKEGNAKAFNTVDVVSGRGNVVLEGNNQADAIRFGYRGGKLDLNGYDFKNMALSSQDIGANIVNHNMTKASTIEFKQSADFKGRLGTDSTQANSKNGELNVLFSPTNASDRLILTGGANLNGNITVNSGKAILQGANPIYAKLLQQGKDKDPEYKKLIQENWHNRHYALKDLSVTSTASALIGRSANISAENFIAKDNATITVGYRAGSDVCYNEDELADFVCDNNASINSSTFQPTVATVKNISLFDRATLNVGKTTLSANLSASENTSLNLAKDALWVVSGDSNIGKLTLEKGAKVQFQNRTGKFNTLTTTGLVSGEGHFQFGTDLATLQGNKVLVKGGITGNHTIAIKDSGQEINHTNLRGLTLFEIEGSKDRNVSFRLEKDYVDAGAFRYDVNDLVKFIERTQKPEVTPLPQTGKGTVLIGKISEAEPFITMEAKRALANPIPQNENVDTISGSEVGMSDGEGIKLIKRSKTKLTGRIDEAKPFITMEQSLQPTTLLSGERLVESYPAPLKVVSVNQPKKQNQIISKYTNSAISDDVVQTQSVVNTGLSVSKQIGKMLPKDKKLNVWVARQAQRGKYSADAYRSFNSRYTQTQLGVDVFATPNVQAGVVFSDSRNSNKFMHAITGRNKLRMLSGYAKYQTDNNLFAAFDLGYGKLMNEIMLNGKEQSTRKIMQAGLTVGKTFTLNNFEIQPLAGVRYSSLNQTQYSLDKAKVELTPHKIVSYLAGINAGYNMKYGNFSLKPFVSIDYSFNRGVAKVNVNNHTFKHKVDNQQNYLAGLSLGYKNATLDINTGVTKGNQMSKQKTTMVKFNLSF